MKSQNKVKTVLLLAALMLSTMLIAVPAYADDTGLKNAASYATGTTGNPATNPAQALADDVATGATNDAFCALFRTDNPPSHVADSQIYYDFSFALPAGATIDGIEVIVSGYRTGTPSVGAYFRARLDGGSGWTAYKDTATLTTADAEYTLGGSSDQWGGSWTADSFSNANFKLEIIPAGPTLNGESWKLDSVRVKVYYTVISTYEGLSHGYWKNHPEDWVGYDPSDTLGSIFTLPASLSDLADFTLEEALDFGGGPALVDKAKILFVQAVAALLNAAHPNIDYPLTVAEVIADVNAALATEDPVVIEALKDLLDGYNNLGGDLSS